MHPLHHRLTINGLVLSVFEWHPECRGQHETYLLAHATGFHARCWDRVIAHLGKRHVIALDQRGHGRSDKMTEVRWADFGGDLAELVRVLELTNIVGVGHSMGGHAMTEAAAAEPDRFRRLVLIDPVIASPETYASVPPWQPGGKITHPTVRRRNHWASPDEMYAQFVARQAFKAWDPAVLRDYCTYGLVPAPSGKGFVLACSPECEAMVYMTGRLNGRVHEAVQAITIPVFIVRAMAPPPDRHPMDFRFSPTWPGLAEAFRNGREVHLEAHTHLLPMEHPDLAARYILSAVALFEPGF